MPRSYVPCVLSFTGRRGPQPVPEISSSKALSPWAQYMWEDRFFLFFSFFITIVVAGSEGAGRLRDGPWARGPWAWLTGWH